MNLNEYQEQALEFAKYSPEDALTYTSLALNEEAGEYAGKIAKWIRKGRTDDFPHEAAAKELGDVLWQTAAAAAAIGLSLNEVAHINLDKLSSREARGLIIGEGDNR